MTPRWPVQEGGYGQDGQGWRGAGAWPPRKGGDAEGEIREGSTRDVRGGGRVGKQEPAERGQVGDAKAGREGPHRAEARSCAARKAVVGPRARPRLQLRGGGRRRPREGGGAPPGPARPGAALAASFLHPRGPGVAPRQARPGPAPALPAVDALSDAVPLQRPPEFAAVGAPPLHPPARLASSSSSSACCNGCCYRRAAPPRPPPSRPPHPSRVRSGAATLRG